MIDLHSHVLPGVDDGASNVQEARAMLEMAAADGTRVLVATPHADLRYDFDAALCRSLLERLTALAPTGLRLLSGCEVHLTPENTERVLHAPAAYSLGGSGWILLELPLAVVPRMVQPAIERLMDSGLRTSLRTRNATRSCSSSRALPPRSLKWVAACK